VSGEAVMALPENSGEVAAILPEDAAAEGLSTMNKPPRPEDFDLFIMNRFAPWRPTAGE
jgi:hypothetical protein